MRNLVQNLLHNRKSFDGIILLDFVTFQQSNNTKKCAKRFIKDVVQNVIHNSEYFNDIILLEVATGQFSNNTRKC